MPQDAVQRFMKTPLGQKEDAVTRFMEMDLGSTSAAPQQAGPAVAPDYDFSMNPQDVPVPGAMPPELEQMNFFNQGLDQFLPPGPVPQDAPITPAPILGMTAAPTHTQGMVGVPPQPPQPFDTGEIRAAMGYEDAPWQNPQTMLGRLGYGAARAFSHGVFAPDELKEMYFKDLPGKADDIAEVAAGFAEYAPAMFIPEVLPFIIAKHSVDAADRTYEETGDMSTAMGSGVLAAMSETGLLGAVGRINRGTLKNLGDLFVRGDTKAAAALLARTSGSTATGASIAETELALDQLQMAAQGQQTFGEAGQNIAAATPETLAGGALSGALIMGGSVFHAALASRTGQPKARKLVREAYKRGDTDTLDQMRAVADKSGIPYKQFGLKPSPEATPPAKPTGEDFSVIGMEVGRPSRQDLGPPTGKPVAPVVPGQGPTGAPSGPQGPLSRQSPDAPAAARRETGKTIQGQGPASQGIARPSTVPRKGGAGVSEKLSSAVEGSRQDRVQALFPPVVSPSQVGSETPAASRLSRSSAAPPKKISKPTPTPPDVKAKPGEAVAGAEGLHASDLPDHAQLAIRQVDLQRKKQADPNDIRKATWVRKTIPLSDISNLPGEKFVHRGSISKGPILVSYENKILDGLNRTKEAMDRGDTTIEAFVETHPSPAKPAPVVEATKEELSKYAPVPLKAYGVYKEGLASKGSVKIGTVGDLVQGPKASRIVGDMASVPVYVADMLPDNVPARILTRGTEVLRIQLNRNRQLTPRELAWAIGHEITHARRAAKGRDLTPQEGLKHGEQVFEKSADRAGEFISGRKRSDVADAAEVEEARAIEVAKPQAEGSAKPAVQAPKQPPGARRAFFDPEVFAKPVRAAVKAGKWTGNTVKQAARWVYTTLGVRATAQAVRKALVEAFGRGIRSRFGVIFKAFQRLARGIGDFYSSPKDASKSLSPKDKGAVNALVRAIKTAKPIRKQYEAEKKKERSRIGGEMADVQAKLGGRASLKAALAIQKTHAVDRPTQGFDPPVNSKAEYFAGDGVEALDWGGIEDILLEHINRADMAPQAKMGLGLVVSNIINHGYIPAEMEIVHLEEIFGSALAKQLMRRKFSLGRRALKSALDIWNIPKTLKSSWDLSAFGRQALPIIFAHPREGVVSLGQQIKAFGSESYAQEVDKRLRMGRLADLRAQFGLYMPSVKGGVSLTEREEAYKSRFLQNIPFVGTALLLRQSERAYITQLNLMRATVFDLGVSLLETRGMNEDSHPHEYEALAKYINAASGRGNLSMGDLSTFFNGVFFSPRLNISYVELPFRMVGGMTHAAVRRDSARMIIGATVWMLMIGGLLKIMSEIDDDIEAEIELDPRSNKFMQIKVGDKTSIDITGGRPRIFSLTAQVLTGKKKTRSGKMEGVNPTIATAFYLSGKESPSKGAMLDIIEGKRFGGKPLHGTIPFTDLEIPFGGVVADLTVPITLQQIEELVDEHGRTGLWLMIPEVLGFGVYVGQDSTKGKSSLSGGLSGGGLKGGLK